jgi:hypothetical protein
MDRFIKLGGPDEKKLAHVANNSPNGINSGPNVVSFDNVRGLLYVGFNNWAAFDSNNSWAHTNNALCGAIYDPEQEHGHHLEHQQ